MIEKKDVNVVVDYFSVTSDVDIMKVIAAVDAEQDRMCHCNNRRLYMSGYKEIKIGKEKLVFVRMIRVRHASYPVVLDAHGKELNNIDVADNQWIGEPSAFLCSLTGREKYLLLLQNKNGVRQTCIAAYLSHFAKAKGLAFGENSVRLNVLVRPGESGTNVKCSKRVMQASLHRSVEFHASDMTVGGRVQHLQNHNKCRPFVIESVSFNLKPQVRFAPLKKLLNVIPNGMIPKAIKDKTMDCIVLFNDFEVTDFLHDAFNYCGNYNADEARAMTSDFQQKILLDAWDHKPFVRHFRSR